MSREYSLQKLLKHPCIWRPGSVPAVARHTVPTGFTALDRRLGGGWPVGGLTEILVSEQGIGELRLLMPALAFLSHPDRTQELQDLPGTAGWFAWIAPPCIPFAPALSRHGVNIARVLIINSGNPSDTLWAMELALRSSVCAVALAWLGNINDRSMRRLQLAVESGHCWAIIFRQARFATQTSPAPLRICMHPAGNQLELNIIRNRYGSAGPLSLQY